MAYNAIVIGASSGGLNALQQVLAPLPANFPLPILIVQHRFPAADDLLTIALNESCRLKVKEADEKDYIETGHVYVAPANYHMLVERDRTISLSADVKVCYSRPSIDVLFESAADVYLSYLIGVILTGANHDGTVGLKKIKQNGGLTVAQDPATAEADMMPLSAIEANIVDQVLSLNEIASLLALLGKKAT